MIILYLMASLVWCAGAVIVYFLSPINNYGGIGINASGLLAGIVLGVSFFSGLIVLGVM